MTGDNMTVMVRRQRKQGWSDDGVIVDSIRAGGRK